MAQVVSKSTKRLRESFCKLFFSTSQHEIPASTYIPPMVRQVLGQHLTWMPNGKKQSPCPSPTPLAPPLELASLGTPSRRSVGAGTVETGMDIAGNPARLTGTVSTSFKRSATGSAGGPLLNGGNGVVGATRTSATESALRISSRKRCWIFGGETRRAGDGGQEATGSLSSHEQGQRCICFLPRDTVPPMDDTDDTTKTDNKKLGKGMAGILNR